MIEKAVAKEISGGYTGISRGFGVFGFNLLGNGKRTIAIPVPSLEKIERLQNAGFAIVTSTHPLSTWLAKRTGTEVPANAHVMAVESVDLKSETITIRNQWNPNVNLVYSRKQFKMLFISIEAMQLKISK